MRSPRRTAGTAGALMVGVAVVTLFTVFAASLKSSIDDAVGASFTGDLAVTTGRFGGGGLSPPLATDLSASPDVAAAAGLGRAACASLGARTSGHDRRPGRAAAGARPRRHRRRLDDLANGTVAVSADLARSHDWHVGTSVPVTFTDGSASAVRIAAIYDRAEIVGTC